ncbi:MAG: hypothetical protein IJB96_03845 [Lachnospira sp.]|nr:hypothetical protein [Lachnospira sp.]
MDRQLLKYTLLSTRRRLGAVARTCIATFLAVFFVTAILLFEENMFE